jgi:hypothetical protein
MTMAKPTKAKPPQHEIDRSLNDAAREELGRVVALADKILQENPFSEPASPFPEQAHKNRRRREDLERKVLQGPAPPSSEQADHDEIQRWEKENQKWLKEEGEWRELAHASRQLRPLLEALIKADEPNSEYAKYGPGFRFRLLEAQTAIAKLTEYERLRRFHLRRQARLPKKARQTEVFDDLALGCFSKPSKGAAAPTASAVWSEMVSKIEKHCADANLLVEEDGARIALIDARGRELRSVSRSSFPTILSRLKRRAKRKPASV